MINQDLLDILVCPATKKRVFIAPNTVLEAVNSKILAGKIANKKGDNLSIAIESALITEDHQTLFLVKEGIPIMLIEESIDISGIN